MLHLAPERVRKDHMADYTPSSGNARRYIRQRMPTAPACSRGVLGRPITATAEKEQALFKRWVEAIVGLLGRRG